MADDAVIRALRAALDEELTETPADESLVIDRAVQGAMVALAASTALAATSAQVAGSQAGTASVSGGHAASSLVAGKAIGAAAGVAGQGMLRLAWPLWLGVGAVVAGGALYMGMQRPAQPAVAVVAAAAPVVPPAVAPPAVVAEPPRVLSVDDLPQVVERHETSPGSAASKPAAPPATSSPAELFREANAARRGGQIDAAERGYRALMTQHPGAPESRAARVSLGVLLLDKKADAAGALREFDAYLAGGKRDTLAEEATLGRARALQRLGRTAEERNAWQTLIEQHPDSLHVAKAKQRLAVLDAASP